MAETQIVEMEVDKDDRLSSLPDEILIEILSHLPIKFAAATSVLSHRWRHLWTGVTRVNFSDCVSKSIDIIYNVLQKLTSQKLHQFVLDLNYFDDYREVSRQYKLAVSSMLWFRTVFRRNVEKIIFTAPSHKAYLCIPPCLFNSQSLVIVKLHACFQWPTFEGLCFHLPNLMIFTLNYLDDIPCWFNALIKASPLLELLDVVFCSRMYSTLSCSDVNIIAPNLKSLSIRMYIRYQSMVKRPRVYIDAPKLANLKIHDGNSIYHFLRNPTTLVEALIDLDYNAFDEEDEEDNGLLEGAKNEYVYQMTKFVGGLSNVSDLKIESWINIFRYRTSVNLPIFSNLTHLETNGSMDLLFSLHCFPNLQHIVVYLWPKPVDTFDFLMGQSRWFPPDSIPDCLVSKLKTIQIFGRQETDDDDNQRMLEYILSNAKVLKKLCIEW